MNWLKRIFGIAGKVATNDTLGAVLKIAAPRVGNALEMAEPFIERITKKAVQEVNAANSNPKLTNPERKVLVMEALKQFLPKSIDESTLATVDSLVESVVQLLKKSKVQNLDLNCSIGIPLPDASVSYQIVGDRCILMVNTPNDWNPAA